MAVVIPPGFAQAALPFKHSSVARVAYITWGVDVSDVGGDYAGAADKMFFDWGTNYGGFLDTDVTYGPVNLRVGQDGTDPLIFSGTETAVGAGGSASLPSNVALLVQKRTNLGGRRGRGRFFVPWIISDDSANDVGIIPPTPLAQYVTGSTGFLEDLATPGAEIGATPMVLLHESVAVGPQPDPTLVTALTVDPLIGTQRRRLARGQ